LFGEGGVEIGPIPKGTPVALLSNLDLLGEARTPEERLAHQKEVVDLLLTMKHDLVSLPPGASDAEANKVFSNLVPKLMRLSKCPDYIINRGHYFGTSYFKEEPALSDADKRALIEYLKIF
jgi:hypothetical protein